MANANKKNKNINPKHFKIINISHLAKKSKISYNRLYNNFGGIYPKVNLDEHERTILINTALEEMTRFFGLLEFDVTLKRKD